MLGKMRKNGKMKDQNQEELFKKLKREEENEK